MQKKSFPLRIDKKLYDTIETWAKDEFRSVNSHIEFLLRQSALKNGRLSKVAKDDNKKKE